MHKMIDYYANKTDYTHIQETICFGYILNVTLVPYLSAHVLRE